MAWLYVHICCGVQPPVGAISGDYDSSTLGRLCRRSVVNGFPETLIRIVSNRCAKLVLQNCGPEFGLIYLSPYLIRGPPQQPFFPQKITEEGC